MLLVSTLALRVPPPRMLFDGVKKAFDARSSEKPMVSEDRITPFDKWLGLDKELKAAEEAKAADFTKFVDPTNAENYVSTVLSKPMGIAFVENEGECGGVCIDEIVAEVCALAALRWRIVTLACGRDR